MVGLAKPRPTLLIKSRRLELNQLLRVFSAALYRLSYTRSSMPVINLNERIVPAVGVEPTTIRLKGGYSAIELHQPSHNCFSIPVNFLRLFTPRFPTTTSSMLLSRALQLSLTTSQRTRSGKIGSARISSAT
jgi:hypothetical protein